MLFDFAFRSHLIWYRLNYSYLSSSCSARAQRDSSRESERERECLVEWEDREQQRLSSDMSTEVATHAPTSAVIPCKHRFKWAMHMSGYIQGYVHLCYIGVYIFMCICICVLSICCLLGYNWNDPIKNLKNISLQIYQNFIQYMFHDKISNPDVLPQLIKLYIIKYCTISRFTLILLFSLIFFMNRVYQNLYWLAILNELYHF